MPALLAQSSHHRRRDSRKALDELKCLFLGALLAPILSCQLTLGARFGTEEPWKKYLISSQGVIVSRPLEAQEPKISHPTRRSRPHRLSFQQKYRSLADTCARDHHQFPAALNGEGKKITWAHCSSGVPQKERMAHELQIAW